VDITELRIRGQVVDVTDGQMFAAALALSDRCRAAGGTPAELREVLAAIGVPEEALRSNLSLADTFAPPRVEPAPAEPVDDDSALAAPLCWKSLHPRIPANLAKCTFVPGSMSADAYARHGPPRVSHGAGSDVRAWWPACLDFELGDRFVDWPDAARCAPEAAS